MANLVGNEVLQVVPIRFDGSLSPISETVTTQDIANLASAAVISVVGATGIVTLAELQAGGVATSASVTAEAARAEGAEATLQTNITAEAGTRATADTTLQTNITAEATARATADTTLQTNINTETNARIAADALKAPLASPAFTGAPTAPTPATGDNDTSIATTAFVQSTFAAPPAAGIGSTTPRPVAATTISATGLITPNTAAGIKGTAAGDNANAGSIGEYLTNQQSSLTLTSGTPADLATLTLSAGDWDVGGVADFSISSGNALTTMQAGISTASATFGPFGSYTSLNFTSLPGTGSILTLPVVRVNSSGSTTVRIVGETFFTAGTSTANAGSLWARRVR